ncbi:MAG: hypothetical protein ABJA66_20610 [Actinomycetota bacterium]
MIFKINNWIKLALGLSLMFSVFSFSAMAQDKPLDAKSQTSLIKALKDVVSKNAFDEKKSAMVAQKWDARKDLAGKTKTQVINLLFEDVKSVITDSGIQYQISSIFSMYKQMPDSQFAGQTESQMGSSSKPEAVEQLTNITYPFHPYVGENELVAKLPGTKDIEAGKAEDRKNRIAGFDAALKANNKLNADQKAFVRSNYDQLIKITDKITEDAMDKNFPTEKWVMEGLDKIYSAKFTLKELNDLIQFFDTEKDSPVLKYIRQTQLEQIITGNGGKLDYTAADQAEYDKFVATPLGKKWFAAFITDTKAYAQNKNRAAQSIPDADGFAIYEPANLNKLFNKFIAENYKK